MHYFCCTPFDFMYVAHLLILIMHPYLIVSLCIFCFYNVSGSQDLLASLEVSDAEWQPSRLFCKKGYENRSCIWSPDGSFIAWSCGRGCVKVVPWNTAKNCLWVNLPLLIECESSVIVDCLDLCMYMHMLTCTHTHTHTFTGIATELEH